MCSVKIFKHIILKKLENKEENIEFFIQRSDVKITV